MADRFDEEAREIASYWKSASFVEMIAAALRSAAERGAREARIAFLRRAVIGPGPGGCVRLKSAEVDEALAIRAEEAT